MAKQKSYVKIKGSLGGLTFYQLGGEELIRTTGGVSKERIMKDPAYKRTRENMSEFGGSATAGKGLRDGFREVVKLMSDTNVVGRVTGMMKRVNSAGVGQRGQRPIEILANKEFIEGFEFNKLVPLGSVFRAPFGMPTLDVNRSVIQWEIPDFNADSNTTPPEGSTHFRLVLAACVLSDYVFSNLTKDYRPVSADENEVGGVDYSEPIAITGMVGSETILKVDLGFTTVLPATVGVVIAIGIVFYQELQGVYYELASDNTLVIAKVG